MQKGGEVHVRLTPPHQYISVSVAPHHTEFVTRSLFSQLAQRHDVPLLHEHRHLLSLEDLPPATEAPTDAPTPAPSMPKPDTAPVPLIASAADPAPGSFDIVVVTSAAELRQALLQDMAHIEIREHLNLAAEREGIITSYSFEMPGGLQSVRVGAQSYKSLHTACSRIS